MLEVDVSPASNDPGRTAEHGHFIWYELMTSDPEGAKSFYDAVIGWKIGDAESSFNGYRMIGRSDGKFAGGVLPLSDEMQQHGARPTWLGYVGVDDVDGAVQSIENDGGKALLPPFDIPGVGRIAMVADPQGASFYVIDPIPPADQPNAVSDVFSPDAEQRIAWNELQTNDISAARRFYGKQFGWQSDDFMPMGDLGEYRFWDFQGLRLGGLYDPGNEGLDAKKEGQPRWRFYIKVGSIDAAKLAVEANGGTIAMGPHQVPTGDWILFGFDPQGAEFSLVGKR